MKILVLGGNGFIGSRFCEFAACMGEEAYSFDLAEPAIKSKGVEYIRGDFFDLNMLEAYAVEADIIIHAVSTLNPGNSGQRYMFGYEKEFIQAVRLCELAQKYQKKLIFLSSGGTVYGEQAHLPIKEAAGLYPLNHYGNLKVCIENVMLTIKRQADANFLIARIANPYGKGQDYHKGIGFIDAVIRRALQNEVIEIWGDGSIERDYIYISDVCAMLFALCQYDGGESIFNISTGVGTSQKKIIEYVGQALGKKLEVQYTQKRTVDVQKSVLDNTLIRGIYHAKPLSVKEGIVKYLSYFTQAQDCVKRQGL